MNRLGMLLLAFGLSTSLGFTQVPALPSVPIVAGSVIDTPSIVVDDEDLPQPPGAPKATAKPGEKPGEADKAKENPRLKKLPQLNFDRKPSTILKAWSTPPASPTFVGPATPTEADPIDAEFAVFRHFVTLGDWGRVKGYLSILPEDEGKAVYTRMVASLAEGPRPQGNQQIPPQFLERNRFNPDDLIGIAGAAPKGLEKAHLAGLGAIFRSTIAGGVVNETAIARVRSEVNRPGGGAINKRQAAQLLLSSELDAEAGEFLPTLDEATTAKDLEALNLLARHFLALHAKEKKVAALEQAWAATQAILAVADGVKEEKAEALTRAVELAPRVKETLGQAWLEASFTSQVERGQEILATLGSMASMGIQTNARNADARLKSLQLQKTAVDSLVKAAPARAQDWKPVLTLLAANWLKEAEFSYQYARAPSSGPSIRRDMYGNIFYNRGFDEDGMYNNRGGNFPTAVEAIDVLANRPGDNWLALTEATLKPKLAMVFAQLHLKVNEDAKAFPHIEELAKTHPQKAKDLVNEFLRVWTKNHDPNSNRGYTNPYMFMYGFERRAESIPLTRSKQERNLVELAGWVERLRKLPVGDPDEELLAKAFTNCHSSAEVYKLEAIEKVFGSQAALKPKTLAGMSNQMRENLAGLWRQPNNQAEKKTKRRTKDIQDEVLRGYGVAMAVIDAGIAKHPDDWSLTVCKAALIHDQANFAHEIEKSSEYAPKIIEAHATFKKAAEQYAAKIRDLSEDEESTRPYEMWFYAALGACDLAQLNEEKLPDLKQIGAVRDALKAIPGAAGERHMSRFANLLFSRMSSVGPASKVRYLRSGFDIVGDHKDASEAKKVFDYYKDLVTELKLETVIDGSDVIGSGKPFGVFVNLRHTREIERESGGFGKYLQNQNSTGGMFFYNYGRPTTDYRDRFQTVVNEAMKEHFEVLSVTFQTDKVTAKSTTPPGWRVTPYAYILLKARGPQIDKLPSVRLDLDFMDTSGYVILPIESSPVPLDAKSPAIARPARDVKVTQILDERKAPEGKLGLEVKATALGLVGDFDSVFDFKTPGFEVDKVTDNGVSIVRYDEAADPTAMQSERSWVVTLKAKAGEPMSTDFTFAKAKGPTAEMVYQRYNDADLTPATAQVSLVERYAAPNASLMKWLLAGVATAFVGVFGLAALIYFMVRKPVVRDAGLDIPEALTPFTLLGFLEKVQQVNGLSPAKEAELKATMATVERHYFSTADETSRPDLRRIAETWAKTGGA